MIQSGWLWSICLCCALIPCCDAVQVVELDLQGPLELCIDVPCCAKNKPSCYTALFQFETRR
jgi:hypothetical protein